MKNCEETIGTRSWCVFVCVCVSSCDSVLKHGYTSFISLLFHINIVIVIISFVSKEQNKLVTNNPYDVLKSGSPAMGGSSKRCRWSGVDVSPSAVAAGIRPLTRSWDFNAFAVEILHGRLTLCVCVCGGRTTFM